MRRVIQYSTAIFLSVCATYAVAGGFDYNKEDLNGYTLQPNLQVSDESDYSRDGNAFYFFGGYLYTKRFLNNTTLTLTNSAGTVTYSPKSIYASTFHGLQLGAGKEWGQHIDFQISYFQHFTAKKTSTSGANTFNTSVKFNGVLGDIGYVFNPDDQFQVMAKVGVMIGEFYNNITVNNTPFYTTEDLTKIDPAIGLDFLVQFSHHFGLRFSTNYIANTQTSYSNGEINGLAALNYTL